MGLFRLRKCRLGACATCRHCARRFNLWYYCALGYSFFGHLSDHDGCDHFDYYLHKPANSPADAATPIVSDKNDIEEREADMLEEDIIDGDELDEEFIDEYVDDEGDFDDDEYLDEGDYDDEDFDQERYDADYYYYGNDGGEYD